MSKVNRIEKKMMTYEWDDDLWVRWWLMSEMMTYEWADNLWVRSSLISEMITDD